MDNKDIDLKKNNYQMLDSLPLDLLAIILSYVNARELQQAKTAIVPAEHLDFITEALWAIGVEEIVKYKIKSKLPPGKIIIKRYKGGVLHSENKPAYTIDACKKVTLIWYCKGVEHRNKNRPSLIWFNRKFFHYYAIANKKYKKHGQLHRTDGPAVEYGEYQEYWVNGVHYEEPARPLKPKWWLSTPIYRSDSPSTESSEIEVVSDFNSDISDYNIGKDADYSEPDDESND